MLEPRIVAARIHGPEAFGHGASGAFDLMTPSSHGWLMMLPGLPCPIELSSFYHWSIVRLICVQRCPGCRNLSSSLFLKKQTERASAKRKSPPERAQSYSFLCKARGCIKPQACSESVLSQEDRVVDSA